MSLGLSEKVSLAVATYQNDVAMGQSLTIGRSHQNGQSTRGEDCIETVQKKKPNSRLGREYAAVEILRLGQKMTKIVTEKNGVLLLL
jgi:hypothetical protein